MLVIKYFVKGHQTSLWHGELNIDLAVELRL